MWGSMKFQYSDGGRSLYYSGMVGDCVTRSFAIGLGKSYLEMYELVNRISQVDLKDSIVKGIGKKHKSSSSGGVYPKTIMSVGNYFGLEFKKKKGKVGKLRGRNYLVLLEEHMTCIKNGIIYDTHDCSDMQYVGYYEL